MKGVELINVEMNQLQDKSSIHQAQTCLKSINLWAPYKMILIIKSLWGILRDFDWRGGLLPEALYTFGKCRRQLCEKKSQLEIENQPKIVQYETSECSYAI